jgi:hypothetical protein
MKCLNCQTDNPEGVKFCGECGRPLSTEVACPQCGRKNPQGTKFCHGCGQSLKADGIQTTARSAVPAPPYVKAPPQATTASTETSFANSQYSGASPDGNDSLNSIPYSQKGTNAYELGKKLEDAVVKILKAERYQTAQRQRLFGEKGTSEIDIVATRTTKGGYRDEIIVECKNFSSPVPVKEVRDFESKLRDLGKKNGLFAAIPDFSRDAEEWAQNAGLRLWNWNDIKEKIAALEIGRLGTQEKQARIDVLPLKVTYEKATNLTFQNLRAISLQDTHDQVLEVPEDGMRFLHKKRGWDPIFRPESLLQELLGPVHTK